MFIHLFLYRNISTTCTDRIFLHRCKYKMSSKYHWTALKSEMHFQKQENIVKKIIMLFVTHQVYIHTWIHSFGMYMDTCVCEMHFWSHVLIANEQCLVDSQHRAGLTQECFKVDSQQCFKVDSRHCKDCR